MPPKQKPLEAYNPLILRSHRLMEAFAKSDDERDFYLDKIEGFIVYVNLDKTEEELQALLQEIETHPERYTMIPKLSFFETKKIMEGFVNEKVYDIDTKEKLLDIIQSKEAREHFLDFIYDHHSELEKWQQYYQERSRIRIIEWLRAHNYHFVFEEDLDLSTKMIEKLKESLFEKEVPKEIEVARKSIISKAKTYYSSEALNPRPKRGRPPKQIQKMEIEPQLTTDVYTTVPACARPFLFTPEITSLLDVTFSSRFETGQELMAHKKQSPDKPFGFEGSLNDINQKLASLRELSNKWIETEKPASAPSKFSPIEPDEIEDETLLRKLEERKKHPKAPSAAPKSAPSKAVKQLNVKVKKKSENADTPTAKKRIIGKNPAATSSNKIAKTPPQKASPKEVSKTPLKPDKKKKPSASAPQQKRPLRKTTQPPKKARK